MGPTSQVSRTRGKRGREQEGRVGEGERMKRGKKRSEGKTKKKREKAREVRRAERD